MNRRRIVLSLLFLVVVAMLAYYFMLQSQKVLVTIEPPNEHSVKLYISKPDQGLTGHDNDPVLSTSTTVSKRLKKGAYVYVSESSNKDYQKQEQTIGIDKNTTIKPISLYSQTKLDSIAAEQTPAINKLMIEHFPFSMTQYHIDKVIAFMDGSWLGVRLTTNDSNYNSMIMILKKDESGLKFATDAPDLAFSNAVYPDIPKDVIYGSNQLVESLDR